jgi:cytochrome c peroxidase
MRRQLVALLVAAALAVVLFSACGEKASGPSTTVTVDPAQLELFQPLPEAIPSAANPLTDDKIALGRMLYYETRLSKGQKLACNSCHKLNSYGVDGEPTSDGHKGQKGDRNSPTVYNAAGHFAQFWDGRAPDVEAQAKGPIMNPVEMAMASEKQVVAVLKSMPEYVDAFRKAFPGEKDPVTYDNMAKAIGAFERKLVTPSRWDKFLRGDQTALTNAEKAGFNAYMDAGCQACHAGTYLGGNQYQRLGAIKPWPDTSDPGREKVTKSEADRMVFKVPSLRDVEKTGPYFHSGKVATLEEATSLMAQYQLGKTLPPEKTQSIVAFLKSLTGDLPVEYIRQPELPKSTSKTPKPVLD